MALALQRTTLAQAYNGLLALGCGMFIGRVERKPLLGVTNDGPHNKFG